MQDMKGFQAFKELRYVYLTFPFGVLIFLFLKKTQHCDLITVCNSFRELKGLLVSADVLDPEESRWVVLLLQRLSVPLKSFPVSVEMESQL